MRLVLRHAWLNLWDKHMTTGRINQVTVQSDNRNDYRHFTVDRPKLTIGNRNVRLPSRAARRKVDAIKSRGKPLLRLSPGLPSNPQTQDPGPTVEAIKILSKGKSISDVWGYLNEKRLGFFTQGDISKKWFLIFEKFAEFSPNTHPWPGCLKPGPIKKLLK